MARARHSSNPPPTWSNRYGKAIDPRWRHPLARRCRPPAPPRAACHSALPPGAIDMAKPLTRDGAIPLLEDAVRLLRRAPLATLLCHLVGSAPLALGLLIFWNDVTNTRTSNEIGRAHV